MNDMNLYICRVGYNIPRDGTENDNRKTNTHACRLGFLRWSGALEPSSGAPVMMISLSETQYAHCSRYMMIRFPLFPMASGCSHSAPCLRSLKVKDKTKMF